VLLPIKFLFGPIPRDIHHFERTLIFSCHVCRLAELPNAGVIDSISPRSIVQQIHNILTCRDVVDLLYNFRFVVQLAVQHIHKISKWWWSWGYTEHGTDYRVLSSVKARPRIMSDWRFCGQLAKQCIDKSVKYRYQ